MVYLFLTIQILAENHGLYIVHGFDRISDKNVLQGCCYNGKGAARLPLLLHVHTIPKATVILPVRSCL